MEGTVAVTDFGWYSHLRSHPELEEVNFWKPSAYRAFSAREFSPFLFKLKAPYNAICGFGFFARYASLPDWLAWDSFGIGNGCDSLAEMRQRIGVIRERISFSGPPSSPIGCILLVQPTFFTEADWIAQPADWRARTVSDKRYDLAAGEGARIWAECLARARAQPSPTLAGAAAAQPPSPRYGAPILVAPRLGQGTFRIAVMEAYGWRCSVSGEHSLPALEAAHIRGYGEDGPHDVRNGLLLRADIHRLFDTGYVTVSGDLRLEVSSRLKTEFANGHSYYPYHGKPLTLPPVPQHQPLAEYLAWHRENKYAA